eukprot:CAMPEP_0182942234 /NCGR_PEP_ID=MMETSP0105_2-20130417/50311_1 /TAXON_ID=81532 ORGANISM="Acanthoeca-like sp., Strain 10tr" /NCGR_SAMPLE_ID=MMETSP0105_2 /ASSEMBLY_ACC=CAM_ASM_000205 /LENGTH=242 /DNA_ID=CAMNT_0025081941 /DNA_START=197 /DNA_END=926 /DNA_ORIENTATION=+
MVVPGLIIGYNHDITVNTIFNAFSKISICTKEKLFLGLIFTVPNSSDIRNTISSSSKIYALGRRGLRCRTLNAPWGNKDGSRKPFLQTPSSRSLEVFHNHRCVNFKINLIVRPNSQRSQRAICKRNLQLPTTVENVLIHRKHIEDAMILTRNSLSVSVDETETFFDPFRLRALRLRAGAAASPATAPDESLRGRLLTQMATFLNVAAESTMCLRAPKHALHVAGSEAILKPSSPAGLTSTVT